MGSSSSAGLCGNCRHAKVNQTRRGPSYLRCLLASVDAAYPRYPRLPVLRCAGYAPTEDAPAQEDAPPADARAEDAPAEDAPR